MILKLKKSQLLGLLPSALMLTRGPPNEAARYLTFDDGPHPEHTPRLLDVLAAHNARASFFMVGAEVERHPAVVERVVAEGHRLGNHSYSHPFFSRLPIAQQLAEVERTDRLLAEFDGCPLHRFRPPRGAITLSLLLQFARRGRGIAYWSYDSKDYQQASSHQIVHRMQTQPPRTGDIVLMHDDSACAGEVLTKLLPEWKADGYRFPELPAEKQ